MPMSLRPRLGDHLNSGSLLRDPLDFLRASREIAHLDPLTRVSADSRSANLTTAEDTSARILHRELQSEQLAHAYERPDELWVACVDAMA